MSTALEKQISEKLAELQALADQLPDRDKKQQVLANLEAKSQYCGSPGNI